MLESYDRNGCTVATGCRHSTFGYWQIMAVDEPSSFSFVDGFADLDFNPDPRPPVSRNAYTFAEHDGGTRAACMSTFESVEALQQVFDMGVVEGCVDPVRPKINTTRKGDHAAENQHVRRRRDRTYTEVAQDHVR